jgi:hypothetical protein
LAISLTVANPSFEAPAYSDGGFAALITPVHQGSYGWFTGDSAGIYNPPALDYSTAGGGGTPNGAHGAQVGWVAGFGDYNIGQRLAGPDGVVGNGDDPVLEPYTIYALTVAVGVRAPGNTYGATTGGYDLQLRAGLEGADANILFRETDAVALQPGAFIERTVIWDSALASRERLGLPLVIRLRKTIENPMADTDFDNVRLTAVYVPPSGDFNGVGGVNGADLAIWKNAYGRIEGVTPAQGDTDRNLIIDGNDFLGWQRQVAAVSVTPVPEPSAGSLALVGLGGGRAAIRRRRAGLRARAVVR